MSLLVRAACLTHYGAVARAGGLDPAWMLVSAGLRPDVETEPDRLIPVERVGRLLHESAVLSGNEAFGLCMTESRRLSNLGAVGLLIRDQATVRDSLKVLIRYQGLLNGSLVLMMEEGPDLAIIREQVRAGKPRIPTRQRVELALGVMVQLMRLSLGQDWQPRRVCMEHSAPRDLQTHHRILGRHLQFSADFNGVVCSKADLDTHNPSADPEMVRYVRQLLMPADIPRSSALKDEVRRAMLWLMPSGRCSLKHVAAHMGVSSRTIQRAMTERGETFSSSLNELRRELAIRHVLESNRPLTEVALLLGFSAASTFSRWYQAQFKRSARDMRVGHPFPNPLWAPAPKP